MQFKDQPIPLHAMWREDFQRTVIHLDSAEAANYGFSPLPNPLYTDALKWCDANYAATSLNARTLRSFDIFQRTKKLFGGVNILDAAQIAIVFDPNRPIGPQMEGLEKHIESFRHHSLKPLTRRHTEKWLRYLRILDARQDGASWSDCSATLLQGKTAATPQTAADTYAQAVKTRDGL